MWVSLANHARYIFRPLVFEQCESGVNCFFTWRSSSDDEGMNALLHHHSGFCVWGHDGKYSEYFFSTFFLLQARVKRFSFSRVHFFHCATLHPPAIADFMPPTFHPCHELYSYIQIDATGGSEQQNMENFRLLYDSPTDSSKKNTDDDESTIEKLLRIAATSSSSTSPFLMQPQEQL